MSYTTHDPQCVKSGRPLQYLCPFQYLPPVQEEDGWGPFNVNAKAPLLGGVRNSEAPKPVGEGRGSGMVQWVYVGRLGQKEYKFRKKNNSWGGTFGGGSFLHRCDCPLGRDAFANIAGFQPGPHTQPAAPPPPPPRVGQP